MTARRILTAAAVAGLLGAGVLRGQTSVPRTTGATTPSVTIPGAPGAGPAIRAMSPIKAVVRANGRERLITLVGRGEEDKTRIAFTDPQAPGQRKILDAAIVEAVRFDLAIDQAKLAQARFKRDWMAVARELLGPLKPAIPYLDLVENNAAELVLEVGDVLMRSAEKGLRMATMPEEAAAAKNRYEAAYTILKEARAAEWSSVSAIAWLKSLRCLVMLDKPKTARHYFKDIAQPFPGDRAMGLYWLVNAELEIERGDFRTAMDAAVRSLAFENKDVDTFPDALLISSQCYEELQEWHRARDVYYEVARIFPHTDWADVATRRLAFIMEKELTVDQEQSPIENVFFGLAEDMNEVVRKFLKEGPQAQAPEYVEPEEEKLTEDELEEKLGE